MPGLYKRPDGRWRVMATGQRFTEPDERRAVARFRAMQGPQLVDVPAQIGKAEPASPPDENGFTSGLIFKPEVPSESFWAWLRDQLITRPEYVAQMTGIPELANLRHLPLPKPAIKLEELVEVYMIHNPSKLYSRQRAVRTFRKLMRFTKAQTLDDLTQEKLTAWRNRIENDPKLRSAGTRVGLYGHVKAIIGFGLKMGMDQTQIRSALDRCKVLWTGDVIPHVDPRPISREHFHQLLEAGGEPWRPWLLLALNLAMTFEDLVQLQWKDFDLEKGTYAAIRVKTRRKRIPRAGVLWPETLEAIKKLPQRTEYVFTNRLGTRYSKNSRVNLFAKLRKKAGLPDDIYMSQIRDAAYTIAAQNAPDERLARVLAGHRAAGLQDNYVLRNLEFVRPACEAIYKAFGPFPPTDTTSSQVA